MTTDVQVCFVFLLVGPDGLIIYVLADVKRIFLIDVKHLKNQEFPKKLRSMFNRGCPYINFHVMRSIKKPHSAHTFLSFHQNSKVNNFKR